METEKNGGKGMSENKQYEIEQIADTIGIIEKGKIIKETERLHSQEGTENLEQYFLETLQGGQNIDT